MSDNLPVAKPTLHRLQELMELRQQVETLETGTHWQPAADWLEGESHLALVLDLPGVSLDSLQITEDERGVQLSGERSNIDFVGEFLQQERPTNNFSRRLELPVEVRENSSHATLKNGVLLIVWEKLERTIDVESE
jgi:HSP20 family protein